ncbi:hypothetical protein L208DRAFT_1377022 [Tricholoma matsutake]|nr:hypothetical protein L208DRAFT_1377022 [Tricholoma matsutake 945]
MSTNKVSAAVSPTKALVAEQSLAESLLQMLSVHGRSERWLYSLMILNEIIEASTPTKKNAHLEKHCASPIPPPGSQAYEDLPAISILGLVLAAMDDVAASGTPPVFGSQYSVTSSGAVVKEHASEMTDKQSVTHPEYVCS